MSLLAFDRSAFTCKKNRHQVLRNEIERINRLPEHVRVLEWGSGLSTILLAETLKEDSSLLSIEDDPNYLFDIPETYANRIKQVHLPTQRPFGKSSNYVTWPVTDYMKTGQGYDLIIVDGRNRADCVAIAAMLLKTNGTVLLCDAERNKYQSHYSLYQEISLHGASDSCFLIALLKKPVCSLTAHAPLSSGTPLLPVRKPVPCKWGVCAVALPRESYYWLKDWIDHHIKAGACKVTIYDNTGSSKSQRGSSAFSGGHFQQERISKRGEEYGRLTAHLSDEQISQQLHDLAKTYDGVVEIIKWQPLHSTEPIIIHGQVEAYCDFIRRHRDTLGWGLFIDMDEYIYCRPGLSIPQILQTIEREHPTVSALHLIDWEFECRWGKDEPKDISKHFVHHPSWHDCGKTFVRLQDATHANVHCDWELKEHCTRIAPHPDDMAFAHYKLVPEQLIDCKEHIQPRAFLEASLDSGMPLRFNPDFYIAYCGAPALEVDTTTVNMYEDQ